MKTTLQLVLATLLLTACASTAQPFQFSQSQGYFGTLTLTGYLKLEDRPCNPGDRCSQSVNYASFVFDSENATLQAYLGENAGNSFVGTSSIGLGCYENDQIHSTNTGDDGTVDNLITGDELQTLLSSSADAPVTLTLTKPVYTSGKGAPECYSHFRNFKIVETPAAQ